MNSKKFIGIVLFASVVSLSVFYTLAWQVWPILFFLESCLFDVRSLDRFSDIVASFRKLPAEK